MTMGNNIYFSYI